MRWVALDCYTAAAGLCGRWGGCFGHELHDENCHFPVRGVGKNNTSAWSQHINLDTKNHAPANTIQKRSFLQLKRFFTRFLFIELLLFLWVSNPFVLALMPPSNKNFVSHESAKLGGSLDGLNWRYDLGFLEGFAWPNGFTSCSSNGRYEDHRNALDKGCWPADQGWNHIIY